MRGALIASFQLEGRCLRSIFLLVLLVPVLVYSYAEGPPSGVTGGFGESTCVQCHVGTALNGGGGKVTITAPQSYSSGVAYPIAVTVFDSVQRCWGFELSVRTQAGKQAGKLTVGSDGFTQLLPAVNGTQYISHTLVGTRNGTTDKGSGVTFSFTWTAPDASAGPVVFNAAANAANGDGTQFFDHIYSTSAGSQPGGAPPSVNSNGTVNNASFSAGTTPLAPGTIAAIFGTNLNDGSSNAFSSFGSDGKLLTTLGGASVTFNGIPAPLFSSFPAQLNVEVPEELAGATSATVQVTVGGQTSAPQSVPLGPGSPGIFTIPSGGTGQGAIQIANTEIFAAPSGSIQGAQAQPANSGDFLTIYCTGLGAVTNPPATGAPAPSYPPSTTTATPQVTIGGVQANVTFYGLAPGFVGLYQVNAQVPAGLPAGDAVPLVLTIGGQSSNTVTVAISGP
jgi:uncharacterized protein (TIGR03437 family)